MNSKEHIYPEGTEHATEGRLYFAGESDKCYHLGWLQGFPHVEVEVYYGRAVIVCYTMVGISYSWLWEYKEEAWRWAKGRSFHIDEIKAAGNEYAARPY